MEGANEFQKEIEKCFSDFLNVLPEDLNTKKLKLLYNRIYELIKEEIIKYGDSKLYYKINQINFDKTILNNFIKDELLELNNKDIKSNPLIINVKDNNYFNLLIIKLILKEKGLYNHMDVINDKYNNIQMNYSKLDLIDSRLDKTQEELTSVIEIINSCKYKFKNKLISLVTLISIILGGGLATNSFAKKYSESDVYTKRNIYIPVTGYSREYTEKYYKSNEESLPMPKSYIRFCDQWIKKGDIAVRNVIEYDISNLNLFRSKHYDRGYFESMGIKPQKKIDKKLIDKICSSDLYKDNIIEFLDIYYQYNGKSINSKNYNIITMSGYILIIILMLMHIEGDILIESEITGTYDSLLVKVLKEYIEAIRNKSDLTFDLKKDIKCLLEYIKSNEYLNNEFKQLYEENKYLLDNPFELNNKLEEEMEKIQNINLKQKQMLKKYKSTMI